MNATMWRLPSELEALTRELLATAGAERWVIEPAVLARSIHVTGWCSDELASAAEHELLRLHQTELAFLLREAARLRIETASATATERAASSSLATWRACFRETLRCASRDGARASAELFGVLRRCRAADVARWPDAVELARAALALHDVEAGRARLGQALLSVGRVHEARTAFAAALSRVHSARACESLLNGLNEAQGLIARRERSSN